MLARFMARLALLLPLARALPTAAQSTAQTPAPVPPIEVMVLGVFHFHNPNADYAQFRGIDVLTPERQRQIEGVVTGLSRFRPTKIVIERVPAEADTINADYQRYRTGSFPLTRNETHQIGFRLAKLLRHTRLYPVDFQRGMRIDSVMAYAGDHDTAFVRRFNTNIGEVVKLLDRMQREETVGANLRFMNEPVNLFRAEQPYSDLAAIGGGDTFIGARVVTDWYERNLHIFANLAGVATPGDRVLLIIGMGHAPILRHLVHTHPSMRLVEPLEYLP